MQQGHQLRFEAVSEDSILQPEPLRYHAQQVTDDYEAAGDLSRGQYGNPFESPSEYHPPSHETLPHFASYDGNWWQGGVSADGKAYTTRTPDDAKESRPAWQQVHQEENYDEQYKPDHEPKSFDIGADHEETPKLDDKKRRKRMRMLEKEFGTTDLQQVEQKKAARLEIARRRRLMQPQIGTLTTKGRLVTDGRKKRLLLRWTEGLLAIAVIAGSIGVAVLVKPASKPPPSGSLPLFGLYGLAPVTLLAMLWLFLFAPCCSTKDRKSAKYAGHPGIQLLGQPDYEDDDGCCSCCGSSKKKAARSGQPTINLLVDPSFFARQQPQAKEPMLTNVRESRRKKRSREKADQDTDSDSDTSQTPSFDIPYEEHDDLPLVDQALGPLEAIKHEQKRIVARSRLRSHAIFDSIFCVLWLVEVVWAIGFGKRCPPGTLQGYCDGYNSALAGAVFLCLCFGTSCILGIRDLKRIPARIDSSYA